MAAFIMMDGWAGRHDEPVEIVGETPKRYRVKLLQDMKLPARRRGKAGEVILVPKRAVKIVPD